MARTQSTAIGGYYKIETEWLPHISNLFAPFDGETKPRIGDFCAGEGFALQHLSERLKLEPYAVELDTGRYQACVDKFGKERVLNDDYFKFNTKLGSFALQLLNPPYDDDKLTGLKQVRLETRFLRAAWGQMAKGGILITVVYVHHLDHRFCANMMRMAEWVDVYRMPELHLGRYMQVVLVAKAASRRKDEHEIAYQAMDLENRARQNYEWLQDYERDEAADFLFPGIDQAEAQQYEIPDVGHVQDFYFRPGIITDEMRLESAHVHGGHQNKAFAQMVEPDEEDKVANPLTRPRLRQISGLIGGGLFNGLRLKTEDGQAVVRSTIRRETVEVSSSTDNESGDTKTVYRDMPTTSIRVLYENGEIKDITGDNAMASFVREHKDALVDYAKTQFDAQYDFDFIGGKWSYAGNQRVYTKGLVEEFLDDVRLRKDHATFQMHDPQKHVAAAAFARLRQHKSVILAAQMRTGKSVMTPAIMDMMRFGQPNKDITAAIDKPMKRGQFNIVLCPPHLVNHWVREIKQIVPASYVFGIKSGEGTKPVEDVQRFIRQIENVADDVLKVLVISREMAKVGETWIPAYCTRKRLVRNEAFNSQEPVSPENPRRIVVEYLVDPYTGQELVEGKEDKPIPVSRLANFRMKYGLGRSQSIERGIKKTRSGLIVNPRAGQYLEGWQEAQAEYEVTAQDNEFAAARKRHNRLAKRDKVRELRGYEEIRNDVGKALWQEARMYSKPFTTSENGKRISIDSGELLAERISAERVKNGFDPLRTKRVLPLPDIYMKLDEEGQWQKQYLGEDEVYPSKNARAGIGGIAKFLATYHADRIYMAAFDEFHELKDPFSAQGLAMGRLANAADKVVGLTGTLYGGVASSIFALEFFTNPEVRRVYGWDGVAQWVKKMGVEETVIENKQKRGKDGRNSERKEYIKPPKEVPGASPELLATLIDHVIFFSLSDLGDAVPELQEEGRAIRLEGELKDNYLEWEAWAKSYNEKCLYSGDTSFMGVMFHASRAYANYPYEDYDVYHRTTLVDPISEEETEVERKVYTIPGIGWGRLTAKEEDLIAEVKGTLAQGKGIVIYVNQTGKRPLHDRLKAIIDENVLAAKSKILKVNTATGKREQWIEKAEREGINVLICNPQLVATGLSLVNFPTQYVYEPPVSLYIVDQATHRPILMSQKHEVRAIYAYWHIGYAREMLVNEDTGQPMPRIMHDEDGNPIPSMDTMEAKIVKLIDGKRGAADFLYGEEGASLSALTEGNSLLDEIAKSMQEGAVMDASGLFKKSRKQVNDENNSFMDDEEISVATPALLPQAEVEATPIVEVEPVTSGNLMDTVLARFSTVKEEEKVQPVAEESVESDNPFTPAQEVEKPTVGIRLRSKTRASQSIFGKLAG